MTETLTVNVGGMTCDGCSSNVSSALNSLASVSSADVSHVTGSAVITHSGATFEEIKLAIQKSGYLVDGESEPFNWTDGPVWRQSAHNTKWCLVGCSIGDFGTIAAFHALVHGVVVALAASHNAASAVGARSIPACRSPQAHVRSRAG